MPYSMELLKDNCYEGTTCLVNKLNIRDEKMLQQVESSITLVKFSYLMANPLPGSYDFEHYREIHRYLFGDLYDWAGEIRTINLSKKGTSFMKAEQIEASANACFERINSLDFSKMSHDELIEEFADFYNTLNLIHPFREGNGRTQRLYFTQWMRHLGYDVNLSEIDKDVLMFATIYAAQGIMDGLKEIFSTLIPDQHRFDVQQTFL